MNAIYRIFATLFPPVSYRLLVLFLALSLSSLVNGLLFSAKLKTRWPLPRYMTTAANRCATALAVFPLL